MVSRVVNYEIAKDLKDLGFKEKCIGYYNFAEWYFPSETPINPDTYSCNAPTWEQVREWFYDNHQLLLEVRLNNEKTGLIGVITNYTTGESETDNKINTYRGVRYHVFCKAIEILKTKENVGNI